MSHRFDYEPGPATPLDLSAFDLSPEPPEGEDFDRIEAPGLEEVDGELLTDLLGLDEAAGAVHAGLDGSGPLLESTTAALAAERSPELAVSLEGVKAGNAAWAAAYPGVVSQLPPESWQEAPIPPAAPAAPQPDGRVGYDSGGDSTNPIPPLG